MSKKRKSASADQAGRKKNGLGGNRPGRSEGSNHVGWVAKMADRARELPGIPKGKTGGRVPAVPVAPAKSEGARPIGNWPGASGAREHEAVRAWPAVQQAPSARVADGFGRVTQDDVPYGRPRYRARRQNRRFRRV